jgi:hypothetical protein
LHLRTIHVDRDAGCFAESGPADEYGRSVHMTFLGEHIFDDVS